MNWIIRLCVLALVASAAAQTTSTEILGLVTDTSGAAVLGAKVTITRVATGQVLQHETNSAGEFSFLLVEIASTPVRVEKQTPLGCPTLGSN